MKRSAAVLVLIFAFWIQQVATGQVPQLINYQGRLLNGTNLVNGNVGLSLRLFNAPVGGLPLYEDSNSVAVVDGLYSTFIGDNTTAGSLVNALTNTAVYVEVAVNGTALSPRERMTSVAYALNSQVAVFTGAVADSQLSTNVARLSVPNTAMQAQGRPNVDRFGFIVSATVDFGGSGYLTPPAVTLKEDADPPGSNAVITANISGGAVVSLTVQNPGANYSDNTKLEIAPPPSNAFQTFESVNYFTSVNVMSNAGNVFAGSFTGNFSGTFSGPGALVWQIVSGTAQQAQPNTGYLLTNDAPVTVTLPTAPNLGDVVRVSGVGAGGWRIAQNGGQSVKYPSNIGTYWTIRESRRSWTAVASSADGNKLVAVDSDTRPGQIYTSTDSGASWLPRESNRCWRAVASSADGNKLVAVDGGNGGGGLIYTSTDSGASWLPHESNRQWRAVASSADGSKLVAGADIGQLYTSTDSGASWMPRESNREWWAVASSADGSKLVAGAASAQLYTSTDSGANWTPRESSGNWLAVASSADGSKLVAGGVASGRMYISADSGVTWLTRENRRQWRAFASSADGSILIAGVYSGQLYISTDSGVNWTAREESRNWLSIACSADGSKLVAVDYGGYIYTSTANSTPGATGYVLGSQNSAVELQYIGNGRFIPISHEGTVLAY